MTDDNTEHGDRTKSVKLRTVGYRTFAHAAPSQSVINPPGADANPMPSRYHAIQ
jgi:hypothetical protein